MSTVDITQQTPTIAFKHWYQQYTGSFQGAAQFIIAEVLVAWVFQRISGMKDHTVYQNAWIHGLSIPLVGASRSLFSGLHDHERGMAECTAAAGLPGRKDRVRHKPRGAQNETVRSRPRDV